MKLGVSVIEASVQTSPGLLADVWDRYPNMSYLPIWSSLTKGGACPDGELPPDSLMIELIKDDFGAMPVVYMQSHGLPIDQPHVRYQEILAGVWDAYFEVWARSVKDLGEIWVRWDHEMNGVWAPWHSSPAIYVSVFERVSRLMRTIAPNIMFWYCPQARGATQQDEIEAYFPGDAAQVVGFDMYSKKDEWIPLAKQWRPTIRTLRRLAPNAPVVVGEFGRLVGAPERLEWLKTLPDAGVDGAIYFDIDLEPKEHRWRMTEPMRRFYLSIA